MILILQPEQLRGTKSLLPVYNINLPWHCTREAKQEGEYRQFLQCQHNKCHGLQHSKNENKSRLIIQLALFYILKINLINTFPSRCHRYVK